MTEQAKPTPDWVAIEADYRAGIKPLRLIAQENGITHGAINKRANRDEWTRSLLAKIQAKADAKVSKAAVSSAVSTKRPVSEKVVIEANADVQAAVRIGHRKDIARGRKLFAGLMDELELSTGNRELFEQLGVLLDQTSEDDSGRTRQDKLNEIYQKVISMPGRVDATKKLVETLEKLVRMEREAHGIDKEDTAENPIDKALKQLAEMKRNGIQPD